MKRIRSVYQLHIGLRDIEPLIWRRVQVWENTRLSQLHRIIQILFNWEECHLHDFRAGRRVYSAPDEEDALFGRKVIDERDVFLNRIVGRVGEQVEYVYDFGDNWRHPILLEAILLPGTTTLYPRCVAGARNGPPEDAGGSGGYARYLEALADAGHPEHERLLEWRGPFDPDTFSLRSVNASLARTFHRRTVSEKAGSGLHKPQVRRTARLPRGIPFADDPKERVSPGSTLPLELTDRERELILRRSQADDDLTGPLRIVPPRGQPAVVHYTLDDLDLLAGYIAFEANHARPGKLKREWQSIFDKISAVLEEYTDE